MNHKVNFFSQALSMSEKWENGFGNFSAFFELWTLDLTLIFGSKMYIFGAPIELEGPGMVSS